MPNIAKLYRELADAYEREEREEREGNERQATQDRIASLERQLSNQPADQRRHALDDLDADEVELIRQHRAGPPSGAAGDNGAGAGDGGDGGGAGDDPPSGSRRRTREGRKRGQAYDWTLNDDGEVVRLDVARVWNEDDEDDRVDLPDRKDD